MVGFIARRHDQQDIIAAELMIGIRFELTVAHASVAQIEDLTSVLHGRGDGGQAIGNTGAGGRTELGQSAAPELIKSTERPDFDAIGDAANALTVTDGATDDTGDERTVPVLVKRKRVQRIPIVAPDVIDQSIVVII